MLSLCWLRPETWEPAFVCQLCPYPTFSPLASPTFKIYLDLYNCSPHHCSHIGPSSPLLTGCIEVSFQLVILLPPLPSLSFLNTILSMVFKKKNMSDHAMSKFKHPEQMPYRTLPSLPSSFPDLPSLYLPFTHSAPATPSACMPIRQVGRLLLRHFSHLLFFICAGKSSFLKWLHGQVPQLSQVFAHRSLLFKFPSSTYSPPSLPASSSP